MRVFLSMFGFNKQSFSHRKTFVTKDFGKVAGALFKQAQVSGQDADEV